MFEYHRYRQSNAHKCKPFSHQRVKNILLRDYHLTLHPVGGYKCNRRFGYVQMYHVINTDNGETVLQNVTLNALRIILTQEGYPLKEEVKPCQGAIQFLEYVEQLKNQQRREL